MLAALSLAAPIANKLIDSLGSMLKSKINDAINPTTPNTKDLLTNPTKTLTKITF